MDKICFILPHYIVNMHKERLKKTTAGPFPASGKIRLNISYSSMKTRFILHSLRGLSL